MLLCIPMNGFSSAMLLPVMIGTGGLLLSACKPGNDNETDLWDMELDAVEISKDIKLLAYRLSLQEPAYGELASLKSGMGKMKAKKQVLLADRIRLQSEVDALEVDHEKMTAGFINSRRSEISKRPKIVLIDGFQSEPVFRAVLRAARVSPAMRAVGRTAACDSSALYCGHLVCVPEFSRYAGTGGIAWGVRPPVRSQASSRRRCGQG